MKRKKKILSLTRRMLLVLVGLLLFAGSALAAVAENGPGIIVRTTDGAQIAFLLRSRPMIAYSDNMLVVESEKQKINVKASDVIAVDFSENVSAEGIDNVKADTPSLRGAEITGLVSGTLVTVHSAEGKLLMSTSADEEGRATLNLSSFTKGVYIITAGQYVFKVYNK